VVDGLRHAPHPHRKLLNEAKRTLSRPRRRARPRVHRSNPRPPDGGLFHFQHKPVLSCRLIRQTMMGGGPIRGRRNRVPVAARQIPTIGPTSIKRPIGLFSRNPALPRGGLFGSDPDPGSPFAGLPYDPRVVLAAAAPTNTGQPRAPSTLGLTRFQNPVEASAPAPDPWSSPAAGAPGAPAAAPTRSVLFNGPPAPWDLGARDRDRTNLDEDLAALDEAAWNASPSNLPLSKSGQPTFPPRPQLSTSHEQALYAAHLLSPNLVDYFTKEIPPPPPFPATPGKIPSLNNPYAVGAALEAVTWFLPEARLGGAVAGGVERGAAEAALQAVKSAADSPALTQAVEQIVTGRYGDLRGTLPPGFQANHLNQHRVYGGVIPRNEGLSVAMRGDVLTEPGTPHYNFHRSLEQFWEPCRKGGSLQSSKPTNAEYGEAMRRALVASGFSDAQVSNLAAQAAAQRVAGGLSESEAVPLIPGPIWR
jgi:hypothetical protein